MNFGVIIIGSKLLNTFYINSNKKNNYIKNNNDIKISSNVKK